MTEPGAIYEPDRRGRRIVGPVFWLACLVATMVGVVVLAILLGAIIAAVVQGSSGRSIVGQLSYLMGRVQSY